MVYDLGVRHIPGLLLTSVTERGIVVEPAFRQPEGTRLFRPWGSVLMYFPIIQLVREPA